MIEAVYGGTSSIASDWFGPCSSQKDIMDILLGSFQKTLSYSQKERRGRKRFLFFCGLMYLHMMLDCGAILQTWEELACDGKTDTLRMAGQKMESDMHLKDGFEPPNN